MSTARDARALPIALALLLLVLGALWLALRAPAEREDLGPLAPAALLEEAAAESGAAPALESAESSAALEAQGARERLGDAPAELSVAAAPAAGAQPFELWLRERDGGRDVAGAELHWIDADAPLDVRGDARVAGRATSDARGRARLPRPAGRWRVFARTPERVGTLELGSSPAEPAQLWMVPARALELRLVDARGRPRAGEGVALLAQSDGKARRIASFGASDAAGRLDLPFACALLASERRGALCIAPQLPCASALWLALPDEPWPSAPLTLTLPDAARWSVRLSCAADARAVFAGRLELALRSGPRAALLAAEVEDGRARFESAPADVEVELIARLAGYAPQTLRARTPPLGGDAELVWELPLREGRALFELADPAGAPLANQALELVLSGQGVDPKRARHVLASDAEGRIALPGEWLPAQGARFELSIARDAAPPSAGGARWSASGAARKPAAGRDEAQGALRCTALPLLAAGRVLDAAGQPVARAQVAASRGSGKARERLALASSAEDGSFQLWGAAEGELELVASKSGRASSAALVCQAGAGGLELRLPPDADLRGRVLLPRGFPPEALELRLAGQNAAGEVRALALALAQDGSFALGGIEAGRYALSASIGREEPCWTRAGLELGGGERECVVEAIDLRTRVRVLEFALVDAAGAPVASARAAVLDRADGRRWIEARGGALCVPSAREALELELYASGYLPRRLPGARAGERIELEAATRVELVLRAGDAAALRSALAALPNRERPWARIALAEDAAWSGFARAELERRYLQKLAPGFGKQGRSAAFELPGPGRYRVQLYRGSRGDARRSRALGAPREIEVAAGPGTQRLALALALDLLQPAGR